MKNLLRKLATNEKGFTMTEMTMVIIILAIGFSMSILYSQTVQVRSDIKSTASNFAGFARTVQSNAKSGKQGIVNSVHLEAQKYVLFEGISYDPNALTNYDVELSPSVSIQNIALNGGGSEIVFSSPKGTTNNYGTFSFFSTETNQSIQITITKIGTIEY